MSSLNFFLKPGLEYKGTTEVFKPSGAVEAGLGGGFTFAFQHVPVDHAGSFCKMKTQFFSLVESSFSLSRPMQRDGNQDAVIEIWRETWVRETLVQKVAKITGKMNQTAILVVMQQGPAIAAGMQRSASKFKVETEVVAIVAAKIRPNVSLVCCATKLAKGMLCIIE